MLGFVVFFIHEENMTVGGCMLGWGGKLFRKWWNGMMKEFWLIGRDGL